MITVPNVTVIPPKIQSAENRNPYQQLYCHSSPTIHEKPLHKAILKAVNEYLGCRDEISKILKSNIGTVMECKNQQEILILENRLKELDKARNDLISLITSGGCDEDTLDSEFMKIHTEEQEINENLAELKKNSEISSETRSKIDSAMKMLEGEKFELEEFDNIIIRKLIECIKVVSKDKVKIIFKGGIEVEVVVEK